MQRTWIIPIHLMCKRLLFVECLDSSVGKRCKGDIFPQVYGLLDKVAGNDGNGNTLARCEVLHNTIQRRLDNNAYSRLLAGMVLFPCGRCNTCDAPRQGEDSPPFAHDSFRPIRLMRTRVRRSFSTGLLSAMRSVMATRAVSAMRLAPSGGRGPRSFPGTTGRGGTDPLIAVHKWMVLDEEIEKVCGFLLDARVYVLSPKVCMTAPRALLGCRPFPVRRGWCCQIFRPVGSRSAGPLRSPGA